MFEGIAVVALLINTASILRMMKNNSKYWFGIMCLSSITSIICIAQIELHLYIVSLF